MPPKSNTPRPEFMRAPSIATLGSSPGSIRPPHRGPRGYRHDFNGSYASLARLPSPAISFDRHSPYPPPMPIRTPTPSANVYHQQQAMISNNSLGGLPKSPTGSTVPQYYDYSESFIEEDCFSPDDTPSGGQPPLTMDQTILERAPPPRLAQTPFGIMEGSTFHPVELPTTHNRRLSDQSLPSFNGVIPKRFSSLGAPALHKSTIEAVRTIFQHRIPY